MAKKTATPKPALFAKRPPFFSQKGRVADAGKKPFFIQKLPVGSNVIQASLGCEALLNTPSLIIVGGTAAHGVITADFHSRVVGAVKIHIPGASAAPQRTEGRPGRPDQIDPQVFGGLAGKGFPDLARKNGTILEVAEIKPAHWPLMVEGEFQLERYVREGNAADPAAQQWRDKESISTVAPMPPGSYTPPATLLVGAIPIVIQWCHPGLLVYKAIGPPPPLPQPSERKQENEQEERVRVPEMLPELVVATGLSALMAYGAKKLLLQTPAGRAAAAAAIILLLASGKAEASIGFGGSDPIEALMKALEQDGVKVPKELEEAIKNDPELKKMVEEAAKKGNLSDAQKELAKQYSKFLNDNLDKFTPEELRMLLSSTESVQAVDPNAVSNLSVEKLKAQLKAKGGSEGDAETKAPEPEKEGKSDKPGEGAEKPAESQLKASSRKLIEEAPPRVKALYEALVQKGDSGGPKLTDEVVEAFFAAVPADLSQEELTRLLQLLASAENKTREEILAEIQKALKALRNAAPTEEGTEQTPPASAPQQPAKEPETPTIPQSEFIEKMVARINKKDWSKIKGFEIKFVEELTERPPLNSEARVILYQKVRKKTPNGITILRSTADLTVKITARDEKKRTETLEVVRSSKVVLEDGTLLDPKPVGHTLQGRYRK